MDRQALYQPYKHNIEHWVRKKYKAFIVICYNLSSFPIREINLLYLHLKYIYIYMHARTTQPQAYDQTNNDQSL